MALSVRSIGHAYTIQLTDYDSRQGMHFVWEDGFRIEVRVDPTEVIVIRAKPEGLISLARHLLTLAHMPVKSSYHFHLDEFNSLETGSSEIVIERY